MKELWISVLAFFGLAWWVEVITETPDCTYYFGPFVNARDAKASQPGYVEDLEKEGAEGIKVAVRRCRPAQLTVFGEDTESEKDRNGKPQLSIARRKSLMTGP